MTTVNAVDSMLLLTRRNGTGWRGGRSHARRSHSLSESRPGKRWRGRYRDARMKGVSPRLLRIVGAYAVNQVGTWFGYIALSVAVYDETHNAFAVAGFLAAAEVLPAVLVPIVVAKVELSAWRWAITALYFAEAVLAAALAVL